MRQYRFIDNIECERLLTRSLYRQTLLKIHFLRSGRASAQLSIINILINNFINYMHNQLPT